MDWDPARRQTWCDPCGAMRAPDGCVHRVAGLRAGRSTVGHDIARRTAGDVAGDVVEWLFRHTLGAIGRGVAAVFRGLD